MKVFFGTFHCTSSINSIREIILMDDLEKPDKQPRGLYDD